MNELDLFTAALEQPDAPARDRFLDEACHGDAELRQRIEALLHNASEASRYLEPSPNRLAPTLDIPLSEGPGTQIGPYKLLEQIGEGGFGVVFMAEQLRPVRRKVALKVIKPGMDSKQVVARFEAERQSLALMDDPHIARVLDAGSTESGRPYFVMELVKGIPITAFCDEQRLATRERLELFGDVCRAIQHAHQKGIIHRDIKPSNVLVTMQDGRSLVKVIDFGVSKAMGQQLTDKTLFTGFAQMVGTPMYMSPEQAAMSAVDVDTRSDVYSLGVLLYELLTGTTPFDKEQLSKAAWDEWRRIIREDEPLRPSARLSTLAANALSTISSRRQISPDHLGRQIRGELDWIVMKTLEKDRQRRYESPNALAADVQRYLDDQPVDACPPSAGYRLRKYARRNRTVLTSVVVVVIALLSGTGLSLWQAFEATKARILADERLVLADERLENEKQARTDATKARNLADQRREQVDEQRQRASKNLKLALNAVDALLLRGVEYDRLAAIPGSEPVREELIQDAIKFYDEFFKQVPEDPQLRISVAKARARLAILHYQLGNSYKAAFDAQKQAIERWEALLAENPEDIAIRSGLASVQKDFGLCELWNRESLNTAESALKRSIDLYQSLQRKCPDNREYAWTEGEMEYALGVVYQKAGRNDFAEQAFRRAVDLERRLWGQDQVSSQRHPSLCISLTFFGQFLLAIGKHDEVEELALEAVRRGEEILANDPDAPAAVQALIMSETQLAILRNSQGRIAEAEEHYRRAVSVGETVPREQQRSFGQNLSVAQMDLADLLIRDSRYSNALPLYRAANEWVRPGKVLHERHWYHEGLARRADEGLLRCLEQIARAGRLDEARKFCEELSRSADAGAAAVLTRLLSIMAWEQIGDVARGRQITRDFIQQMQKRKPDSHKQREREAMGRAMFLMADWEFNHKNYDDAFPLIELALRWNHESSEALDRRGQIFLFQGDNNRAISDLDASIVHGPAFGATTYRSRALAHLRLSHYGLAASDFAQAFQLSQDGVAILSREDLAEFAACRDTVFHEDILHLADKSQETAPSRFHLIVARANLYAALRRHDKALASVTRAATIEPNNAQLQNNLAWFLATCPDAKLRDASQALIFARRATELKPQDGTVWNTRGVVEYRLGDYLAAVGDLQTSMELRKGGDSFDWFFLAMAHWQLGNKEKANELYDQAVGWMKNNKPLDEELLRFQKEAEELMKDE